MNEKKRGPAAGNLKRLTFIAAMTALICVCSWLTVPYVVPFTMQTFAVFCALLLLGGRDGLAAVGLYLLMGVAGLPVFSGFQGGVGHLLGPTGGYIIGFLFTALAYLLCEPLFKSRRFLRIPALALGLCLCYLVGTAWFVVVFGMRGTAYGFGAALSLCVLPYILPDLAKLLLAVFLCDRVGKRLRRND